MLPHLNLTLQKYFSMPHYTGKYIFYHMKTNLCLLRILHTELKCYLNCPLTHSFCVTEFFKM